ncbi:MAG: hypothetical protein OXG34_10290 [bacterium]|nr:hypothetical protein [bacterium]
MTVIYSDLRFWAESDGSVALGEKGRGYDPEVFEAGVFSAAEWGCWVIALGGLPRSWVAQVLAVAREMFADR